MKYRKKPVVVEAIQWNGVNLQEIIYFVGDKLECHICDTAWKVGKDKPQVTIKIKTLEGEHIATEGDYIIKGVHGEFYPCKSDIFEKTYEPATNTHFDRIKAMSVEEIAELLIVYEADMDCYYIYGGNGRRFYDEDSAISAQIQYLESEVQE